MTAIKTHALTKRFGDILAVDDLELSIPEGETFALLGVNGAGKTTAIKMLSCLIRPTSGGAEIMGHSICDESLAVKELINVSPQETAVAPNLSVRENLELICALYGHDKTQRKTLVQETIDKFNLGEVASRRASTLSGGWMRRLSIAMALITDPKILFLDEPTLGLDVLARRELWEFIESLKGKMTVILTTHYLEEAEALSDRIGIMVAGRLVALGSADELKAQSGKDNFEDAFVALCKGGGAK
ncbi:MAG: ABC transporter ATP-binding protein [Oscillospiraceae bacterium]|nr:ABC transporter ATP-binding protein [Oscillospiraceae bacterium]